MSVKVIDKEMFLPSPKAAKASLLTNDIKEIVEKEIEYSELELPYSPKTSAKDIEYRAKRALLYIFQTLTGFYHRDSSEMPLEIVKRKDKENNFHLLCHFDVQKWAKMLKEVKEN